MDQFDALSPNLTPLLAHSAASPSECSAPALPTWCGLTVECTKWTPSRGPGDRIGYADITLDGRLALRDVRLVRRAIGGIVAFAPHQYMKNHGSADQRPTQSWFVPDEADRRAFDAAVVAAAKQFQPGCLPDDVPAGHRNG
jgi:hypothetical protein